MKKIRVLSISNSFGVNLQTYAHQIAKANGVDLDIYVLYIGGCSLDMHVKNVRSNEDAYELFHNGESTHKMISIKNALKIYDEWDYILTQQCSQNSGLIETYDPYLDELYNFVTNNTKFVNFGFQETWAYSEDMEILDLFKNYNCDAEIMYKKIQDTVLKISIRYKNWFIVNSGDIIHNAITLFKERLYDSAGFHMSNYGCYLIGANLVKLLIGKKLEKPFFPNEEELTNEFLLKAIEYINNQKAFR